MMTRPLVFCMLILALASLACRASAGQVVMPVDLSPSPTPTLTAHPSATALPVRQVCAAALNVRSQPDPGSPILGTLVSGAPVQLLNGQTARDGGAWAEVKAQNVSGWVNTRYLCEK